METYKINLDENFPHLPNAPINEAVIEIRTPAATNWEKDKVNSQLDSSLKDYPRIQITHKIKAKVQFDPDTEPKQHGITKWHGFKRRSEDGHHIAQFNRDSFIFSRLKPYQKWTQFIDEAMRLWRIHCEIAQCTEVGRIGLRYVNRIISGSQFKLEDYLTVYPHEPNDLELPYVDFIHKDTHYVPGHPYLLTIAKTAILEKNSNTPQLALILDIDVHANVKSTANSEEIVEHLTNMKWLKNKAFFGSITEKAKEMYR